MNIWTIYQFASTPRNPGSERTFQFARAFANEGHEVTLWTSSFSHWGKSETITDDNIPFCIERVEGLNLISLKTRPSYHRNDYKRFLNMLNFANALYRTAKKRNPKPDVIIASYPSPFAAVAAYFLAKRYKAKFILEIRDLWPRNWIERGAYSRYHPFIIILSMLEKYLYSRTRYFVTVLPYVSEYLSEKGIKPEKVSWIPNGIHLEEFKTAAQQPPSNEHVASIIRDLGKSKQKGDMNVIYVGGIGVGNRVDYIVEAALKLKEKDESHIAFFIIGEGHSKEDLEKYVSAHALENVKIYPAIPRTDVPRVLNCSDVGILCLNDNPVYRYGVNLHKIYDYMAAALPIVFSAKVRNDLVESSGAGITVPPASPDGIADALIKIRDMSDLERGEMGERGRSHLSDNFNIEDKLLDRYIEIIHFTPEKAFLASVQ